MNPFIVSENKMNSCLVEGGQSLTGLESWLKAQPYYNTWSCFLEDPKYSDPEFGFDVSNRNRNEIRNLIEKIYQQQNEGK